MRFISRRNKICICKSEPLLSFWLGKNAKMDFSCVRNVAEKQTNIILLCGAFESHVNVRLGKMAQRRQKRELLLGYRLLGSLERGICVKFMENYALNWILVEENYLG
jgi:hypothetical protein